MTLTRRLLLLALISVLPAIAIWTYTEVSLRQAREAEVHELAIRHARLTGIEIERIFDGIESLLLAVEENPSIQAFDAPACGAYLKAIQDKVPQVLAFAALDISGNVRCSPSGTTDRNLSFNDREYFLHALEKRAFVVGLFTKQFEEGGLGPYPVLPLALPIWNGNGGVVGVLVAALDLKWLDRKLKERALPEDGSITIADRRGVILAREPFPERFVGTVIPASFQGYVNANDIGSFEAVSQDGTRRILGFMPAKVQPDGVYISVGLSTSAAFASINQAARQGFMFIGAALVLAIFLSWFASHTFISKPFQFIIDAVQSWQKGNYLARISLPGNLGELSLLAKAFNDLMDGVTERQQALQASEERARLALEAGHMGTWWFDHLKGTGGWSSQAAHLLGLPATKTTTTLAEWRELVHPDDADQVFENLRAAVFGNGDYSDEFRVRQPSGRIRWISSKGQVFFDTHHRPVYFVGIFQDITERKYADEQQRLLLDELNHRVKNTLATVQSIATQTLRATSSPEEFQQAFEGRLLALSKTHNILTRKSWREADLHDVAGQELAPYRKTMDERVVIKGPSINLPARYAINLGLVLHELVTNAAKYGALSSPTGRLDLNWNVERSPDGGPHIRIRWEESGGPPVEPPKRQGFGSRLIRRSIEGELAGKLTIDFAASGVTYDILAPLP